MTSIHDNRGVINNMKIKNTKFSPNYAPLKKNQNNNDNMYNVESFINTGNLSDSLENESPEHIYFENFESGKNIMDYSNIHNVHSNEISIQTLKIDQEKIDLVMDSKLDKIHEEQRVAEDLIEKHEKVYSFQNFYEYIKNYNFYINCSKCLTLLAYESKFKF
jgi:hypothetical protein